MTAFTRLLLGGSTNGLPIPITATSGTGTLIHQALAGTSGFDEVWAWASNVTSTDATLTIQWGGTTSYATYTATIPANSPPYPIMTGQMLQNALYVRGVSNRSSAINITGYINRIA